MTAVEQVLCWYIEELRADRSAKAVVHRAVDGLRTGVKAEQDLEAVREELERVKERHQEALNSIAHHLGVPHGSAWNLETIEARIDALDCVRQDLAQENERVKADLASAQVTIDGLRRTIEHANETKAWPAPSPLPDGTKRFCGDCWNYNGVRCELPQDQQTGDERRTVQLPGSLACGAFRGGPLPDGVPGKVWIPYDGHRLGSYWCSICVLNQSETYYHSSVLTAKVAEEREACLAIVVEQARFGSEVARIIDEHIRERGSKP